MLYFWASPPLHAQMQVGAMTGRRAAERDPTRGAALTAVAGGKQRVGRDDVHEPTVLSSVYFALDREACQIKIGFTTRPPEQRIAELSIQRGRSLELLGSLRGGYDLERAMHGRFRAFRREGHEWYGSEIIGEVARLLA